MSRKDAPLVDARRDLHEHEDRDNRAELRERWKTEHENARMLHASTAVAGGPIVHYYTPYERDVSAVRALRLDGSTAWTGEWPFFMCFHAHLDSLYFGGDAARRVEIATRRAWSPYAWPTVEAGRVYALSGNRFVVFDEATGELICDTTIPELADIAFKEEIDESIWALGG